MTHQLPDRLTPIPLDELLVCYHAVWLHKLQGTPPPIHAIEIFAAQWAIETGWGKHCHCWNLGNAKAKAGGAYDWTFFPCGEELSKATAEREAASDSRVTIVRQYVSCGRAMASVHVEPEHPWCCFRAFETIDEGAADHLILLHRRFPLAFTAALSGDPVAFASELKRAGYYTASVAQYTKGLVGCLPRVRAASAQIAWESCATLTDWQKARIDGVVALAAELSDDDWASMRAQRDAEVFR